ncbi:hypothetical protein SCE1572_06260 [Sorangium cellulosum So0157-2]|uniref:Uncharacterized protein n=1 Tax=Sorangium cellulosum So0157-2 TaxID=1254432 RepID=S4XNJ1_SORCE|nr:hypothetical protein SCE1572_06260 [Sorangium cellulosum So0157-2]
MWSSAHTDGLGPRSRTSTLARSLSSPIAGRAEV